MTFDTLTFNGTEKSFADWGFSASSVYGRKINLAADEFQATIGNTTIAAEATIPTFPFEAQITVRVNRTLSLGVWGGGTIKFQGKRVGQPLRANAHGQGVTYRFQGPWYDLENTHYQQIYQGATAAVLVPETALFTYAQSFSSGGQEFYYGIISVGDQLQFVLEWLLAQYTAQSMAAPFKLVGHDHTAAATCTASSNGGFYAWPSKTGQTISSDLYSLFLPSLITKPIMCAEALKKCIELVPRANLWFDYTTTPPTFHCTTTVDKTSKTLPLFDGVSHKDISIVRRDDLVVRAVNLVYRITKSVNGSPVIDYALDKWGPNGSNSASDPATGLRVVSELIDIQGGSMTTVAAHLDTEPVLATAASGGTSQLFKRTWWASKRGGDLTKLEDFRVRFHKLGMDANGKNPGTQGYIKTFVLTSIPDATIIDATTGATLLPADLIASGFCDSKGNLVLNRHVRGTCHAWMIRSDGQPVVSKKVKLVAAMSYATYDIIGQSDLDLSGICHSIVNSAEHHVHFEITNGVTGAYSSLASSAPGESWIIGNGGIAQYLYQQLSVLQYDGEAIHVAASFADSTASNYVDLGCVLNLSGGATEWATMNAQIQSIEEDYANHQTKIQIGVAKHLNAGQLSSLLNMWRNRRAWYNPAIRSNNAGGGGIIDQPITAGGADNVPGVVNNGAVQYVDYSTQPCGSTPGITNSAITIDPTQITANNLL